MRVALLCFMLTGCVGAEFTVEPPWADGGNDRSTIDAGVAETAKLTAPLPDAGPLLEAEASDSPIDVEIDAASANDAKTPEEATSMCVVANCRCIPVEQMPCCREDQMCGCIIVIPAGDGSCR